MAEQIIYENASQCMERSNRHWIRWSMNITVLGETYMISEPKLEDRTEKPYMGIRTQVSMQELSSIIPQLLSEVSHWLEKQSIKPSGASFIRYYVINMAGNLDIELGWPVATRLTGEGHIMPGVLPTGRYASVIHTGDYASLIEANRVLVDWAKDQRLLMDRWDDAKGDAFRSRYETYFRNPENEPDSAKWETEVAIKLAD